MESKTQGRPWVGVHQSQGEYLGSSISVARELLVLVPSFFILGFTSLVICTYVTLSLSIFTENEKIKKVGSFPAVSLKNVTHSDGQHVSVQNFICLRRCGLLLENTRLTITLVCSFYDE
jgi:hypothetical protein